MRQTCRTILAVLALSLFAGLAACGGGGGGTGTGGTVGPAVVSALAADSTAVRITFDRAIEPTSVLADGSQFVFTGGLTASAAVADSVYVTVTTSSQVPATAYSVTVGDTVTDSSLAGVDAGADSAGFAGFSATNVVINELYYDSPSTDTEVFAELWANGDADLTGLSLVGVNGADGSDYQVIALTGTLSAGGIFVVADTGTVSGADMVDPGADFQNGPDSLQLVFDYGGPDEFVVDALAYGSADGGEGTPAPDVSSGSSLSRCPDGQDTDDNSTDFIGSTPTPGVANICL